MSILKSTAILSFLATVYGQHIHGGFTINNNQYTLTWEVHHDIISFRAIANGTGFVGFGISPKGTMEGSDLFLAGMYENGTVYGFDAHGAGVMDAKSNYQLHYVVGGMMHTEVYFSRMLHTGDCMEDIPILNEPQYVIWSVGPEMDKLEHHGDMNRGAVLVNLLNPPMYHSYYHTKMNMVEEANKMCMEINKRMEEMGGMGMGGMKPPMMGGGGDEKPAENAVEE